MFKLTILNGPQVDLGQMLAAKDARVVKERALLVAAPTNTRLHVHFLRIPGPVKTGTRIAAVFSAVMQTLAKQLGEAVRSSDIDLLPTGPEAYFLTTLSPLLLKRLMVAFENQQRFCDLLDLMLSRYAMRNCIKFLARILPCHHVPVWFAAATPRPVPDHGGTVCQRYNKWWKQS